MREEANRQIANMDGNVALPRDNGELVFEAPWEGRAFSLAVAMNEDQLYEWVEFRDHLANEIVSTSQSDATSSYYEQWLLSLEKLVIEKGLVIYEKEDDEILEIGSVLIIRMFFLFRMSTSTTNVVSEKSHINGWLAEMNTDNPSSPPKSLNSDANSFAV